MTSDIFRIRILLGQIYGINLGKMYGHLCGGYIYTNKMYNLKLFYN